MDISRLPTFTVDDDVILEYVVLQKKPFEYACKTIVVGSEPKTVNECPVRTINDTITFPATSVPELVLKPVFMCPDPFRKGRCKLVFCEQQDLQENDGGVSRTSVFASATTLDQAPSSRQLCKEELEGRFKDEEVWLGFEQEYYIVDDKGFPISWDRDTLGPKQSCKFGRLFGERHVGEMRHLAETHLRACLFAGLDMYGYYREDAVSMWEYQIGPAPAVDIVDQLHVSRFILMRLCEMVNVNVTFLVPDGYRKEETPETFHVNFSTKAMRNTGGLRYIQDAIENLAAYPHQKLLQYYDSENGKSAKIRLNMFGMPPYDKFVSAVAEKCGVTIRIPGLVDREKKGYFEERRVANDADIYTVARMLTIASLCPRNPI